MLLYRESALLLRGRAGFTFPTPRVHVRGSVSNKGVTVSASISEKVLFLGFSVPGARIPLPVRCDSTRSFGNISQAPSAIGAAIHSHTVFRSTIHWPTG